MEAPQTLPISVVIVEWNWRGHHPDYFKQFCRSILAVGLDVIAACPEPEEVEEWLVAQGFTERELSRRFWKLKVPKANLPWLPVSLRSSIASVLRLRYVNRWLIRWSLVERRRVHHAFFACILDQDFTWPRRFPLPAPLSWRIPWSGLLLHVSDFRSHSSQSGEVRLHRVTGGILARKLCRGILVLDEAAADVLRRVVSPLHVAALPDIAGEPNLTRCNYALRMRQFAGGKPLIGVLGRLNRYKALVTLAKVARSPENDDLRFVALGEIVWNSYPCYEAAYLREAFASTPNLMGAFERIDDDEFDSAVAALDLVFLAYEDFHSSSNVLTKAAVLKRPVIVSEGGPMAERVRKYDLGVVVPQRDPDAVSRAIRSILARTEPGGEQERIHERFCRDFSLEAFDSSIRGFFQVAMQREGFSRGAADNSFRGLV